MKKELFILKMIFLVVCTGFVHHPVTAQNTGPVKPKMVFVKGGWFDMGPYYGDAIHTVRRVYLDDYYIGKYEVSNKEYADFLNAVHPSEEKAAEWILTENCDSRIIRRDGRYFVEKGFANYPVTCVTWWGAEAYCEYFGGRLPTEAEWEYAARGGNRSKGYIYSGSNDYFEVATVGRLEPCGSKKPNELGIYNMAGNAGEYCYDWYLEPYPAGELVNPKIDKNPNDHPVKSVRGGNYTESLDYAPVTIRRAGILLIGSKNLKKYGFRMVIEKK